METSSSWCDDEDEDEEENDGQDERNGDSWMKGESERGNGAVIYFVWACSL